MAEPRFKTVTIVSSPVTERVVRSGMKGTLDTKNNQIQVNGYWFEFHKEWKVTDNVQKLN